MNLNKNRYNNKTILNILRIFEHMVENDACEIHWE